MEYKYNLAKLQDDKEDIEQLITRQSQRVGPVFPQNLEQEFWTKNLERARKHVEKYVWAGVLAYFLFTQYQALFPAGFDAVGVLDTSVNFMHYHVD